jgi:hypothetical protein
MADMTKEEVAKFKEQFHGLFESIDGGMDEFDRIQGDMAKLRKGMEDNGGKLKGTFDEINELLGSSTAALYKQSKKESEVREALIKGLEVSGKNFQASWKKFIEKFKTDKQGFNNKAGKATEGLIDTAKDPKKALLELAGPWAALLEMFIDTFDTIRKTTAELHRASAASGNFADGMAEANDEAIKLVESSASLATQGLDVAEVTKVMTALKNTGVAALGSMKDAQGGLTDTAKATIAFAKASGEGYDAVAKRFANFVRNFGSAGGEIQAYSSVLANATTVAQDGIMTTESFMQAVDSLGDSFADVGINIKQVGNLTREVARSMKGMGLAVKDVQAVSQGILGLTKASSGWKAMMAGMSGMQGNFAQQVYGFEQRSANFDLTKKGKKDFGQMVSQGQGMMSQMTGGIADGATKRMIQEQIGGSLGMDEKTLQVFQNLDAGKISQEAAATELSKLYDAAKANNMSSKDMFDILKGILMGAIAWPITQIYKGLKYLNPANWGGDSDEKKKFVAAAGAENTQGHDTARSGLGEIITSGGMMRVHAGETLSKTYGIAKTQPITGEGRGDSGNLSLAFSLNLDENSIKESFRKMEQKTLELMARQQKSNYAG